MIFLSDTKSFVPGYNLRINDEEHIDRIDPVGSYCIYDSQLLASLGYGFLLSRYRKNSLIIELMYLPKHMRGKGLASRALIQTINFARSTRRLNKILLSVEPSEFSSNFTVFDTLPLDSSAQLTTEHLYIKHGFTITTRPHPQTGMPLREGVKRLI